MVKIQSRIRLGVVAALSLIFLGAPTMSFAASPAPVSDQRAGSTVQSAASFRVISISGTKVADGVISGTVQAFNASVDRQQGVYLAFDLSRISNGNQEMVESYSQPSPLDFEGRETKSVPFSFLEPKNVVKGAYQIAVTINSQTGIPLAIKSVTVTLEGAGQWLDFESHDAGLLLNGKTEIPLSGPSYGAGEQPIIQLTVINPSSVPISGSFSYDVYAREMLPGTNALSTSPALGLTLQPNERKTVQFPVTIPAAAESYLLNVSVKNAQGESISPIQQFRAVRAGEGGKVLSSTSSVAEGFFRDYVAINARVVGSPDQVTIVKNARVVVIVTDPKTGSQVVTASSGIPSLGGIAQSVRLALPSFYSSAKIFKIETRLLGSDGSVLNSSSSLVKVDGQGTAYAELGALLALIAASIIFFIAARKRKLTKGAIMSLILLMVALGTPLPRASAGYVDSLTYNCPHEGTAQFCDTAGGWQGFNPSVTYHFDPPATNGFNGGYENDFVGDLGYNVSGFITVTDACNNLNFYLDVTVNSYISSGSNPDGPSQIHSANKSWSGYAPYYLQNSCSNFCDERASVSVSITDSSQCFNCAFSGGFYYTNHCSTPNGNSNCLNTPCVNCADTTPSSPSSPATASSSSGSSSGVSAPGSSSGVSAPSAPGSSSSGVSAPSAPGSSSGVSAPSAPGSSSGVSSPSSPGSSSGVSVPGSSSGVSAPGSSSGVGTPSAPGSSSSGVSAPGTTSGSSSGGSTSNGWVLNFGSGSRRW